MNETAIRKSGTTQLSQKKHVSSRAAIYPEQNVKFCFFLSESPGKPTNKLILTIAGSTLDLTIEGAQNVGFGTCRRLSDICGTFWVQERWPGPLKVRCLSCPLSSAANQNHALKLDISSYL